MKEERYMARKTSYTGKYKLTKNEFLYAKHYALRYKDWKRQYNALHDTSRAIVSDGMPHSHFTGSLTEEAAIKAARLDEKMQKVEDAALEADPDIYSWILQAVTEEGVCYQTLRNRGLCCGRRMFYERRRKFYYLLAQKI